MSNSRRQPGKNRFRRIDDYCVNEIEDLWKRVRRKQSLYVGFLHSRPDDLPDIRNAHDDFVALQQELGGLSDKGNPYARQLLRYLSSEGQQFLDTVNRVIDKPATQDTVVSLFHALAAYNRSLPLAVNKQREITQAEAMADHWLANPPADGLDELLRAIPEHTDEIRAMLIIAQMGELTLFPIFGLTDALGSVMRKKLKPLTDPLQDTFKQLTH